MCYKNALKIAKKRKKAYLQIIYKYRKRFSFENVLTFEYI